MLLTITTTHNPATDLGYLLHKNPERVHEIELSFGTARVSYSESRDGRTLRLPGNPGRRVRRQGRATGRFLVDDDGGERPCLESKPLGADFCASQQVVIETPGAGGYGPPSEREPEMLARDYRGGRFSTAYFKEHYRFDPKKGDNPGMGKKP